MLALAGCSGDRAVAGADIAPVVAAHADQAEADVPPATAPAATAMPPPPANASLPADGAIGYAGFGPARFGDSEAAVRMAWGKDIDAAAPAEAGGCYYLFPLPMTADGYGIGFMIDGDKFARIDVDRADIAAPGGGRVGMSADEIRTRYAGDVEEQDHKYVEGGQYLRIEDRAGGNGVLLFATDAAGRVTAWRTGVPPQLDYIEGCG